jgi:hypothetical protein
MRVNVYDSMNKEESTFDQVFQLIDRAWDRFRQLVHGTWKEKLGRSVQSRPRELTCAATTYASIPTAYQPKSTPQESSMYVFKISLRIDFLFINFIYS